MVMAYELVLDAGAACADSATLISPVTAASSPSSSSPPCVYLNHLLPARHVSIQTYLNKSALLWFVLVNMSKQTATANMSLPDLPDLLLSLICSRLDGCSLHAIHSLHSGLRKCALDHVQGLSVVLTSDLHTVVEQARAKFTELRRGKPLPLTICSGDSRPAGLHGPGGWHDSALDLFLEWSMLSSALFTLITPLRLSVSAWHACMLQACMVPCKPA